MQKRIKVTLYVILILAIITIVWLMFGNFKPTIESQEDIQITVEEDTERTIEKTQEPQVESNSFEEDVMNGLEGFFGSNNGYEDVEGEYGFNNPENE